MVSGLGREGEQDYLYDFNSITNFHKKVLLKQLKAIVLNMTRNKSDCGVQITETSKFLGKYENKKHFTFKEIDWRYL